MTAFHDPINAPAAMTASASPFPASPFGTSHFWANPLPELRGWITILLFLAAILANSAEPAKADIEVAHAINHHTEAPVEAGTDAAKTGRIRDAITILTPHANNGHAMANYILGLIYVRDHGALTSRPALSHRHFSRAASAGHVSSIFEAAFQFERGIGTAKDMGRAMHLYRIAARANHLNAQFNLAVLLSHRKAEYKTLQQAYFWAVAARNNAVRTGAGDRQESRIAALLDSIRPRIPHQAAAQASAAAARLTGQPV